MADHTTAQYIYGDYSKNWRLRISYTYTQNTTTKKTTCVLTLQVYNNNEAHNNYSNDAYYIINGTKTFKTFDYPSTKSWHTLGSKTETVTHNSKGEGSLSVSGSWHSGISGSSYTPNDLSVSGKITFDKIPVASTVAATNASIGSKSTITLTGNSGYTHTLSYSTNGGSSYTTIASNVGASYSWTLPSSLYNSLGSTSKSLTVTIRAETFDGSTSKGTNTCTLTATAVESDCKPTLNPSITDSNSTTVALTGSSSTFIKYFSNASIKVNATAKYGATISSYKVVCGAKTLTSATGTINAVESGTFNITVTDSRGYITTQTVTKELIEYIKPTVSLKINNANANGQVSFDIQGSVFSGSLGTRNNTRTIQIRYKEQYSSTWGSWTTCSPTSYDSTKKQYSYSGTLSLNYTKSYSIQASIKDTVTTTQVLSESINVTFVPMFYWGKTKFKFNVPTTFTENISGEPEELRMLDILKDIYIYNGETMELAFSGGGYITTGKKQINFVIPLRKSGKYVNKVTINSFDLNIRQNGNYLHGSATSNDSVKTNSYTNTILIEDGYLNIRVVKTSEFSSNAINNDAVGIYAKLNLTFSYDSSFSTSSVGDEIIINEIGNEGGD